MPKKKKLMLGELKVKSFVTQLGAEAVNVKGGTYSICKTCGSECYATCEYSCGCLTDGCTTTETDTCDTCNTCGTCLTCEPCNFTIERTCGPECSAIGC